uniref:Uncharacterized protein n=1 Tax=Sciurus vulgaris TaxID=55149 RepID=A0A8D2AVL6_SCIVU
MRCGGGRRSALRCSRPVPDSGPTDHRGAAAPRPCRSLGTSAVLGLRPPLHYQPSVPRPVLHAPGGDCKGPPQLGDRQLGGFGLCGISENLIAQRGRGRLGLGLLLATQQVRRVDRSDLGENTLCEQQYLEGELDLEPTPRGTVAERIQRAAPGARLLGAHPLRLAGAGRRRTHQVTPRRRPGHPELPRKVREFQGQLSLLEHAIGADFPLAKGWKADRAGNVILKELQSAHVNFISPDVTVHLLPPAATIPPEGIGGGLGMNYFYF